MTHHLEEEASNGTREPLTGDLLLQRRHRIRPVPTESQNRTRNPTPVCTPPT